MLVGAFPWFPKKKDVFPFELLKILAVPWGLPWATSPPPPPLILITKLLTGEVFFEIQYNEILVVSFGCHDNA